MIFMFGAHTAVIEKAVKMDNPDLYDRAYYFATVYVYVITVPAGITVYHTFGIEAAKTGNAFYLLERSPAQLVAASLMCIHEWVAFGLFVGELWLVALCTIHIHFNSSYIYFLLQALCIISGRKFFILKVKVTLYECWLAM